MVYLFKVKGRVQGVWYRKFVSQNAKNAGFKGYVKNLPDGSVEAAAEIESPKRLEEFIQILKKGSPYSDVQEVEYKKTSKIAGFDGFEIRY